MYIIWFLLAGMVLYLTRVARGPSIWDRLLGLSLIATKIILVITVYASFREAAYLLDLAIVCALLGFISIIFTAQFLVEKMKGGRELNENRRSGNNAIGSGFYSLWRNWHVKVQEFLHKDTGDG